MNLNRKRAEHLNTGSGGPQRAWRRPHGPRGRDQPPRGHVRLHRWFVENTYRPRWLPERWCHPLAIYMAAILLQLGAALAMAQLVRAMPEFAFRGSLAFLVTLCVSLWFGVGPGLVSVVTGSLLVYVSALSPWTTLRLSTWDETIDVILSAV